MSRLCCVERFEATYGKEPLNVAFCPYRVCPIGAHSDHQLGKITGMAIDKGIHIAYAKEKNTSCLMRFYEGDRERLKKSGNVSVDENGKITNMIEKPQDPPSNWCCTPFYYYTRQDAKLVKKGLEAGCGIDAPGSYMVWLCKQTPVHAMEMPGKRYDIGDLASYEQVQKEYRGIVC